MPILEPTKPYIKQNYIDKSLKKELESIKKLKREVDLIYEYLKYFIKNNKIKK